MFVFYFYDKKEKIQRADTIYLPVGAVSGRQYYKFQGNICLK